MTQRHAAGGVLTRGLAAVGIWGCAGPLWAQAEESASVGSPYIVSYVLIFVVIGLGVLAVCRVSRRGVWQVRGPHISDS